VSCRANERVVVKLSLPDILDPGTVRWCKHAKIPLLRGYRARVSSGIGQFAGSSGTMTRHSKTSTRSHRQFPFLDHHLPYSCGCCQQLSRLKELARLLLPSEINVEGQSRVLLGHSPAGEADLGTFRVPPLMSLWDESCTGRGIDTTAIVTVIGRKEDQSAAHYFQSRVVVTDKQHR